MALATYKDLCIDARSAAASARFWGAQLDLEPTRVREDVWRLTDTAGTAVVWVNQVPEPVTVKNRMHLDLNARSLATALDAGATVVDDDSFPWTLMRDPDGQELCVFVRSEPVTQRLYEVVWDCGNSPEESRRAATWWGEVLGGQVQDDHEGYSWIERVPRMPFECLVFQPVPEPKTVKNRVHIDVATTDLDALLAHGARVLREKDGDITWHVLADPDGNEFCAFVED